MINHDLLWHTSYEKIPLIMEHASKIYELALKEQDPQEIQKLAGAMFWWICQAKPWKRGDPSIAEIIVRAIFKEIGFESLYLTA